MQEDMSFYCNMLLQTACLCIEQDFYHGTPNNYHKETIQSKKVP